MSAVIAVGVVNFSPTFECSVCLDMFSEHR